MNTMDKQIRDMDKTIRRVSLFRAMKNARRCVMGLLIIDFVQRVVYHYPVTGLYIFLLNALVPFLIELVQRNQNKETKEKELPILQERFEYDRVTYYGQGGTAILTAVTLLGWYGNTKKIRRMSWQMKQGPLLLLAVYVGVLSVMFFRYFRESKERLNNNKL